MKLGNIFKRSSQACRHHWHPAAAGWNCCWCRGTTSAVLVAPRPGTAECLDAESFATTLPPARSIGATTAAPSSRRRKRADVAA